MQALRGVWMQLRDKASVIDELSMARIRLRVRYHNEPRTDVPQPDVLEPTEVEHHKLKLLSDRIVAQGELQKKLGQLLYLRNLSKSEHGKRGGSNPDPCPICQRKLGEQVSGATLTGHISVTRGFAISLPHELFLAWMNH